MKLFKSIMLGVAAVTMLTSCNDWLDVNVNPNTATSVSASYELRLGHIEFYTNSAHCFANWRVCMGMGDWTRYSGGGNYYNTSIWYPTSGLVTTAYQWWFVGAACNLEDMRRTAEEAGAWHYVGVADLIHAYGYMLMTDLHGEMPYTDGIGENAIPKYDNGKTIYLGCLEKVDQALEYLAKPQDASLPALSVGDWWMGGDVQKWIKFGNFLKARWINKLIKKGAGSYKDGKYDEAEILACLDRAMKSINDDVVINHTDDNSTTHDVLGWDEPVDYSPLYSVCGMNAGYMITETLYKNLTEFCGLDMEDPRADKIIPWAVSEKGPNTPAEIKWDGIWRRSMGVDMTTDKCPAFSGGPLRASFSTDKNWYVDSDNAARLGDTIYVECTSESKGYSAKPDLFYRRSAGNDRSRESGSFYSRVSSPTYIATYSEACFIKAEVLARKNDLAGAKEAYKAGVRASMEQMNKKLTQWCNEDSKLAECPSFTPMSDADITAYVNKLDALGFSSSKDAIAKILTQKRLALHFDVEIWNDMRRYDFDEEIFLNWKEPSYHPYNAAAMKAIPAGKQYRRWQQCSHELNYNTANLHAIGSEVPGARMDVKKSDGTPCWNAADDVWTIHVWWDSNQD